MLWRRDFRPYFLCGNLMVGFLAILFGLEQKAAAEPFTYEVSRTPYTKDCLSITDAMKALMLGGNFWHLCDYVAHQPTTQASVRTQSNQQTYFQVTKCDNSSFGRIKERLGIGRCTTEMMTEAELARIKEQPIVSTSENSKIFTGNKKVISEAPSTEETSPTSPDVRTSVGTAK